jgi:hypothetical protein
MNLDHNVEDRTVLSFRHTIKFPFEFVFNPCQTPPHHYVGSAKQQPTMDQYQENNKDYELNLEVI